MGKSSNRFDAILREPHLSSNHFYVNHMWFMNHGKSSNRFSRVYNARCRLCQNHFFRLQNRGKRVSVGWGSQVNHIPRVSAPPAPPKPRFRVSELWPCFGAIVCDTFESYTIEFQILYWKLALANGVQQFYRIERVSRLRFESGSCIRTSSSALWNVW